MWSVEKPAKDCGLANDADVALNPRSQDTPRERGGRGMRARAHIQSLLVSSSSSSIYIHTHRIKEKKASGKDEGEKKETKKLN